MRMDQNFSETIHASRNSGDHTGAPLNRMLAGLTALAVAMALALAMILTSAVPSHADKRGDDLAKALAAALIIGTIINHLDNNNPPAPAPQPPHVHRPWVPSVCAMEIDRSQGHDRITVYPERCLRDAGFRIGGRRY